MVLEFQVSRRSEGEERKREYEKREYEKREVEKRWNGFIFLSKRWKKYTQKTEREDGWMVVER
jgi:hypothetical protein